MGERESGGKPISRRILFSRFKPKNFGENISSDQNPTSVDAMNLKLSRREFLIGVSVGAASAIADIGTVLGLDEVDVPVGNASAVKIKSSVNPALYFALAGIYAPINEEVLFRALPSVIFASNTDGNAWGIGAPSSFVFALSHNIDDFYFYIIPKHFSTERVPLTSFIDGLIYWKMFREGGYAQSVVAHSAHNNTLFLIGLAASTFDK